MDIKGGKILKELDKIILDAAKHKKTAKGLEIEILKLALRLEELADLHYSTLAGKVSNKSARSVFTYLATDEKAQIKSLKVHLEAIKKGGKWLGEFGNPKKGACPIIAPASVKRKVRNADATKISVDATDLDALKLAIEIKKRAVEFYCTASSKIADKEGKRLFAYLAGMEAGHLTELEVQSAWLEQAGFWWEPDMMMD